jgi:formate hydrogenlyase transcriptional activator
MASLPHGFEKPRDVQDIRLVVDTIPTLAWSAGPDGSADFFNQRWLDYTGLSAKQALGWGWEVAIHPDDLPRILETFREALNSAKPFEVEGRFRRFDGEFLWFLFRASPLCDESGKVVKWYGTNTDIEDRKRAEDALRSHEQNLRLLVDTIPGFVVTTKPTGEIELLNRRVLEYFDKTPEELANWRTGDAIHPDDLSLTIAALTRSIQMSEPYEVEHRLRRADGVYRWFHTRGHALRDEEGRIVRWYYLPIDVTEQHEARAALQTAFEQIKAEETELRRMTDAIAGFIYVFRPDGTALYANQQVLDYTGLTLEDVEREDFPARIFHPEDVERLLDKRHEALARGKPFELEKRELGKDGRYRWFLVRYNPLRDDQGNIIRWYATGTDIEDRKRAEERMRDENLALREEIDQAFMFEEIVGASPALQTVLSSVVKVAPTDSTVLITGETGTGKELIARAIHKHSQRSGQAFISVNCASMPSSLIASELFGHEKGAFTGALQRRQGRFEMAHSGTIFLDEVGDLPVETQIALLRVLQERQFERVGGNRTIPTDVRIIAATNRDLTAAIAAGTFRVDLFYRLNVFPIEVPPLRERKEDIPMLMEYFVKRYAEKAGKHIRRIDKNTLELCQSYPWPGNIRELQNIVERSVILCSGDTFWIEKAWLASVQQPRPELAGPLPDTLQKQERKMIETALAESKGKVAGTEGAAAKLGIPRSTLDTKIKQLKIKKHKFISEQ